MSNSKVRQYKAKYLTASGDEETRVFIADSKDTVIADIISEGNTPLKVSRVISLSASRDMSIVRAFFKNLTDLLKAGYSVNTALEVLEANEKNPAFRGVVHDVLEAVNRGYSITEGLGVHPEWFTTAVRTMVETGEQAGRLIPVFEEIVKYIDKEMELSGSIMKEMTVPMGTLLFGIIILFFNVFVTIPKITSSDFYKEMMAKSAGPGLALVEITAKLVPIVIAALVGVMLVFFYIYRTRQEQAEYYLMKIPIVKAIWFNKEVFLLYFSLSKLLSVGVNLDAALDIIAENARIKSIRQGLRESAERVRQGLDISPTMPILDEVDRSLIKNITTTKHLSEIFENISARKYDEYQRALKKLPVMTKTFTYIVLAYLFFIIFLGVVVPYYRSINSAMQHL